MVLSAARGPVVSYFYCFRGRQPWAITGIAERNHGLPDDKQEFPRENRAPALCVDWPLSMTEQFLQWPSCPRPECSTFLHGPLFGSDALGDGNDNEGLSLDSLSTFFLLLQKVSVFHGLTFYCATAAAEHSLFFFCL